MTDLARWLAGWAGGLAVVAAAFGGTYLTGRHHGTDAADERWRGAMVKIEADFVATKGRPLVTGVGGRTVNYKSDDFALDAPDRKDFEKKKAAIRAAVSSA